MIYLFQYDTLFLLNSHKTQPAETITFKYPLYQVDAKIVFLLHYKTINTHWLPPSHQELFEKIVTAGFKYSLEDVVAYNIEEVIQNSDIQFKNMPDILFCMSKSLPNHVKKWINKQNLMPNKIIYLPSLAQMIDNQEYKMEAWKEIQKYQKKGT